MNLGHIHAFFFRWIVDISLAQIHAFSLMNIAGINLGFQVTNAVQGRFRPRPVPEALPKCYDTSQTERNFMCKVFNCHEVEESGKEAKLIEYPNMIHA